MAKLWTEGKQENQLDPRVEAFCFEKDVILDQKLVYYDIIGSIAHASMLESIQVLTNDEFIQLKKQLQKLLTDFQQNKWTIKVEDEDVHSAVEGKLDEIGAKLHTARSRNDQVLTDMRLFSKDHLLKVILKTIKLANLFLENAKKFEFVPMPGYTHLQRAMPASYGMWMASYTESLIDILSELQTSYQLQDQSPLGSGAGFGVSLDIDRQWTSDKLGFAKVQSNSLYCQNSRGLFEANLLSSLTSVMSVTSRFAADICLYCSEEFSFIDLPSQYFTGSSIMPQKKNPDLFELIRTKVLTLSSLESRVRHVTHGISSGYSKDLQEIKEPVMEGFQNVIQTLDVLNAVIPDMKPKEERLNSAMSSELFAAHEAYQLVKQGIPFRQAYHQIKKNLKKLTSTNAIDCIKNMKHIGATGCLGLDQLMEHLVQLEKNWLECQNTLHSHWNQLSEYS